MLNLNHKRLDVWKLSMCLIKTIYEMTNQFPKSEMFGITSQLRRASVSIASNIAEGCSRRSSAERKRFFEISRSSLVEVDTQLEICIALGLVENEKLLTMNENIQILFAKMSNLIFKTK